MPKKTNQPWIPLVKEFLSGYDYYQQAADALGISRVILSFWVQGRSRPALKECYKIERITEGRIKAEDLLEGHPLHYKFKDLKSLIEDLYLADVRKKMTKAFRDVELLPSAISLCIKDNLIPSDKFCYLFSRVIGRPARFWQAVKATLEYRKDL